MLPKDLKYTPSHEWVKIRGRTAYIGLTEFALEGLGKVLNLELPNKDDELLAGVALGDVETVDALHEIVSPVEGIVTEVNKTIFRNLDVLLRDPYKRGWLIKIKLSALPQDGSLLSAEEYLSLVQKKLKR